MSRARLKPSLALILKNNLVTMIIKSKANFATPRPRYPRAIILIYIYYNVESFSYLLLQDENLLRN